MEDQQGQNREDAVDEIAASFLKPEEVKTLAKYWEQRGEIIQNWELKGATRTPKLEEEAGRMAKRLVDNSAKVLSKFERRREDLKKARQG